VERLGFWVGTWNVDSLTGKASEVVEALMEIEQGGCHGSQ